LKKPGECPLKISGRTPSCSHRDVFTTQPFHCHHTIITIIFVASLCIVSPPDVKKRESVQSSPPIHIYIKGRYTNTNCICMCVYIWAPRIFYQSSLTPPDAHADDVIMQAQNAIFSQLLQLQPLRWRHIIIYYYIIMRL